MKFDLNDLFSLFPLVVLLFVLGGTIYIIMSL